MGIYDEYDSNPGSEKILSVESSRENLVSCY